MTESESDYSSEEAEWLDEETGEPYMNSVQRLRVYDVTEDSDIPYDQDDPKIPKKWKKYFKETHEWWNLNDEQKKLFSGYYVDAKGNPATYDYDGKTFKRVLNDNMMSWPKDLKFIRYEKIYETEPIGITVKHKMPRSIMSKKEPRFLKRTYKIIVPPTYRREDISNLFNLSERVERFDKLVRKELIKEEIVTAKTEPNKINSKLLRELPPRPTIPITRKLQRYINRYKNGDTGALSQNQIHDLGLKPLLDQKKSKKRKREIPNIGGTNPISPEEWLKKQKQEQEQRRQRIEDEQDSCPVCLEKYTKGEELQMLKACSHKFHRDCLRRVADVKRSCPMCRESFFGKKRKVKRKTTKRKKTTQKRKTTKRSKRKLPEYLKRQARKLKIRLTVKRNGKRVYKSEKQLKEQIKRRTKNKKTKKKSK